MHHPIDVVAWMVLGVCSVLVMRRALRAGTARLAELEERGTLDAPPQTLQLDRSEREEVAS
jgi:hypothetical protein